MNRPYSFTLLVFLVSFAAGCVATSGGEVAVVTERPEPTVAEPQPEPMPVAVADASPLDTVLARRFDSGKMWTFDNPPLDYFEQAYGFRPDEAWFEKARLGALRFSTYCSASFVSPRGLVMTNHHCGRESITDVSKPGEELLDNGFYAESLEQERKVKDLYVEQLLSIEDVTRRIETAGEKAGGDDQKAAARREKAEAVEKELTDAAKSQDTTLYVQVVELYNGGKYSAYTFRRYNDVRLVQAPELGLGYFGGDPDNFTYPRYSLDMTFFRVYGPDGTPIQTDNYFAWSESGTEEGDAVFVVGNPGTTSRLSTVSALLFERDFNLPTELAALERRLAILAPYVKANPDEAEEYGLRNAYFSLANSQKANTGQLAGLRDPYLIARRRAAEKQTRQAIAADADLQAKYGTVYQDLEELQRSKEATAPRTAGFAFYGTQLGSRVLTRALYGYYYDVLKRRGLPAEQLADIRKDAVDFEDWPEEVEKAFIAVRFEELQAALGTTDPTLRSLMEDRTPMQVAEALVENSALVDSSRFAELLDEGYLNSNDPSVEISQALVPLYFQFAEQQQNFQNREENLNAKLARARFELYGTSIPPDASFSLRLSDGVVKGYDYNGTKAPAYTTFFGLYNHYHAYRNTDEAENWDLPERWLTPPESFDRSTPYNLVSTNDITGGNSGSPLLNSDLEVVGLVFDGNIESLPNQYLYTDETARTVSVDARGILEVLDDIYDADRLVLELTTGQMASSEAEADAARGTQ